MISCPAEQHTHKQFFLLLLGDSLIDYGEWHRRLPRYRILSSGVPGERSEELLERLPARLTQGTPDLVVVMSGTNNFLSGDSGFVQTMAQIVSELHRNFASSAILISSLLPYRIAGILPAIISANQQLEVVAQKHDCHYFDLFKAFERSAEALFDHDGIHLRNCGYRLWALELERYVAELLAKGPD